MTDKLPLSFFVTGLPHAQPRHRTRIVQTKDGRVFGQTYNPSGTAKHPGMYDDWRRLITIACNQHWDGKPVAGDLALWLEFRFVRPKGHFRSNGGLKASAPVWARGHGDIENMYKTIADVLQQGGVIVNDGDIVTTQISKVFSYRPGVSVTLYEACTPASGAGVETCQSRNDVLSRAEPAPAPEVSRSEP